MRQRKRLVGVALVLLSAAAAGGEGWHDRLYLGNGGLWRQRVRVEVRNETDAPVAGSPVTLRVGRGADEADLAGPAAEALRVCDAKGTEMLHALTGPDGRAVRRGPIPPGSTLTVPAECPARATAAYYVYFDNPLAWAVPDFLQAVGGLRNGGMESGSGDTPAEWRHDAQDAAHRLSWTDESPHSGRRCLKTTVADGAEATWIATRQGGLAIQGGARYVLRAWVKARDVKGYAGWYIHVGNAANSMLIAPTLSSGEGTYDWKQVTATFTAPPEANLASLGTVLRGTGTAWFDDVTLECLTPPRLSATASPPEKLGLKELGRDAAWHAEAGPCRLPVTVANFADQPSGGVLAAVDVGALAARFRGRTRSGRLVVRDGAAAVPCSQLKSQLLFEADLPARTARTYHAYLAGGADDGKAGFVALHAGRRNLARNAGFEQAGEMPANWPSGAEGGRPTGATLGLESPGLFGSRCAKIHVPQDSRPAWIGWRQDVPVKPGRTYLYAAWVKCRDVRAGTVQLHAHYRNAAGQLCSGQQYASAGPAISGTADWTLMSGTFTMPPDIATFQLHLTMDTTGTVWHDGVLLAEVAPATPGRLESRGTPGGGLAAWPVNAVVKVFQEDAPPDQAAPARIAAARNEAEPLQLALRSGEPLKGLTVHVDPPANADGRKLDDFEVGLVGYVPIDHKTSYYRSESPPWHRKFPAGADGSDGWAGLWPDPILPGKAFDLPADTTRPVWVTFRVPATAAPGDYAGAVRIMQGDKPLARVPLTVRVWDFALPAETRFPAIYDVRLGRQWARPGKTTDEVRRQFWRFMADYRVCPDRVQPDPVFRYEGGKVVADFTEFDKAAEYYFDVLKLPHTYTPWSFYLFGWGHPPSAKWGQKPYEGDPPYEGVDRSKLRPEFRRAYQACLRAYWEHMKAKGWDRKCVLYISDEPFDSQEPIRQQMKTLCEMIHEVDPAIPIYSSTWHHQPAWDGSLGVWGIGHHGVVSPDRMRQIRAGGARLWFTTDGQMCTDTPYCAVERLLPHYCFHYGVEAYEFWGIDWLTYDPYEFGWHSYIHQSDTPGKHYYIRYPNGDGFLAYPGGPAGSDGPVPSIRLAQARDGVEDYEYLRLLAELVAKARAAGKDAKPAEAVLQQAAALVTIPNAGGRYSTRILPNPDAVFRVRQAVAEAIEKLKP